MPYFDRHFINVGFNLLGMMNFVMSGSSISGWELGCSVNAPDCAVIRFEPCDGRNTAGFSSLVILIFSSRLYSLAS